MRTSLCWLAFALAFAMASAHAQNPYFVTYDHHLEDPGDLEIATFSTAGVPRSPQPSFFAPALELEYGVKKWWTSSFYLEGQSTAGDSTIFTGWRLENRFRPFRTEHAVNPVLYFEYENVNEASRIEKEIVGHATDFGEPNSESRQEHAHELETKLILSSTLRGWNIAENFIVEKNLSAAEGFEFGYAFGVARQLGTPTGATCRWCRQNFIAGMEVYGGLGSTQQFGFHDTAHYVAPALAWRFTPTTTLRISPAIGVTHGAAPLLLRIGCEYEVEDFGKRVTAFFRR